ncbi:MAG: DNA-3-methyladenine glycosylase family protein [Planctomycetaceae bacterium]
MPFDPQAISAGTRHLRRRDPVMRAVIDAVGPFTLTLDRDRFRMLVRSIIAQQISGSAARSIRARLDGLVAPGRVSPEKLAALTPVELRSAGLSPQKAAYLHDLAAKVTSRQVRLHRASRMTDDEVIADLTQVKGIGVWTAQMFLMFSLGRLDVFPHADLGIRSALKRLYVLRELPDRETSQSIAACWSPYATIASWYCWRSHEVGQIKLPGRTGFPG